MARPLNAVRNPFEIFFLVLGLASGLPLLFGAPPPASVAHLLSPTLVHVWACFLIGGCLTALFGIVTRRLDAEQLGLVSVGVGTLIYGVGIIATHVPGSGLATGYVLAYGLACFWRYGQIWWSLRVAIRQQERQ